MSIRVLIAEDQRIVRDGLVALFRAVRDIEVAAVADNGCDAWAMIEAKRPDVAILEVRMRRMSGLDIARRSVAAGTGTRILLLTGCDDPAVALEAQEIGCSGYVLKDQSIDDLVLAIRTLAAGGSFLSPAIRAALGTAADVAEAGLALSRRERDVAGMIAMGKSGKEIARLLEISPRTVNTYRERLMSKLRAHNVADVVRYAIRVGLVT